MSSIYWTNAFIELNANFFSAKFSIFLSLLSTTLNLKFILFNSSEKNLSLNFVIYTFSNLSLILFISSKQLAIIEFITNSDGVYLAISSNNIGKLLLSLISAE